ncbi:unnamed protein product, partial [marine sediment metagenome]
RPEFALYRNQKIGFSAGVYGYNGAFCFFQVEVDGTGGWMQRDGVNLLSTHETKTVSGWIPADATTIKIAVHTGTGPIAGPVFNWWDWIRMHCP